MKIFYGTHINQFQDPLEEVAMERIVHAIRQPKPEFRTQVERLRLIRSMDSRQYQRLKVELPYLVAGAFHPPVRRKDHFAAIQWVIVDLDHIGETSVDLSDIRKKLIQDDRLVLLFDSPGGQGLKLFFRLEEKCSDPGLFSLFYKAFIHKLAATFQLERWLDTTTHDVTRACFLSYDPSAYWNPNARPLILNEFIDPLDMDQVRSIHKKHQEWEKENPPPPEKEKQLLDDDLLKSIKQQLNPNYRPRERKNAFVPQRLSEYWPKIEQALAAKDIVIVLAEPIQYGKKIRVSMGPYEAELNIFYGKRGFSIVKTTKTNNNKPLAELTYQILTTLLIDGDQNIAPWEDQEK